jgi:hypothetical protein
MRRKLSKWLALIATAGTLSFLFSGCAWQIGGDKKGTTVAKATRGQELIDLKNARAQGAMSEDEYQAQRKKIMEQ